MATPEHDTDPSASEDRRVSVTPGADLARVSEHCAAGRHTRCLATVYRWPYAEGEERIVPCECPLPDCGHASAEMQAKRRRQQSGR